MFHPILTIKVKMDDVAYDSVSSEQLIKDTTKVRTLPVTHEPILNVNYMVNDVFVHLWEKQQIVAGFKNL